MKLNDLIEELEKRDPLKLVKNGFGEGMSARSSYDEAAFEPVQETTFGEMLSHARELLGTTQRGYKGGKFVMDGFVDTHIAEYGSCGEPITSYHFKYWDSLNDQSEARDKFNQTRSRSGGDCHLRFSSEQDSTSRKTEGAS